MQVARKPGAPVVQGRPKLVLDQSSAPTSAHISPLPNENSSSRLFREVPGLIGFIAFSKVDFATSSTAQRMMSIRGSVDLGNVAFGTGFPYWRSYVSFRQVRTWSAKRARWLKPRHSALGGAFVVANLAGSMPSGSPPNRQEKPGA
jgi:hypothetical protein